MNLSLPVSLWPPPHASSSAIGSVVVLVALVVASLRRSFAHASKYATVLELCDENCLVGKPELLLRANPNPNEEKRCDNSDDELAAAAPPCSLTPVSVLIVCLGNVCRSPLAEAILVHEAQKLGLPVRADSAGSSPWMPYLRPLGFGLITTQGSLTICHENNIHIQVGRRSRQVTQRDFHNFDYILATDSESLDGITAVAPKQHRAKVLLFGSFDDGKPIPDPYWLDEATAFQECFESIRAYSHSLLKNIYGDGIFSYTALYQRDPDGPDTLPPSELVMLRSFLYRICNAVMQRRRE